jgi:hypothetical protein
LLAIPSLNSGGRVDVTIEWDGKGEQRESYHSDLPKSKISTTGAFSFKSESLKPGRYGIVVQNLGREPVKGPGEVRPMPLLEKDGDQFTIIIPERPTLSLRIGVGSLKVPTPGGVPQGR